MSLIEKIAAELGIDDEIFSGIKYSVFDGHSAYIQGIKGIISFTDTQIELQLKKGKLILTGENLFIKKLWQGDAAVCGNIISVVKEP